MTQPQHDDPFAEVRGHSAQVLAVAATVGEAAARWYAVRLQDKARDTENANTARNAAEHTARAAKASADREANTARDRAERRLVSKGLTDWLDTATLDETVRLWRAATIRAASGEHRAGRAATRAYERLRAMNQPLMDAYDRHRAAGMGQADAMRAAAYHLWQTDTAAGPGARPHGNDTDRPGLPPQRKILTAGGTALDALDAAVRDEAGRLAQHINPEALDRLQREWRTAGRAPAAEAAELLQQFAEETARLGMMPPVAADALAQRGQGVPHRSDDPSADDPAHAEPVPTQVPRGGEGRLVQPQIDQIDRNHEVTTVEQRLTDDAADEARSAAADQSMSDDPRTPRTDEHQGAQARAQQHADHSDAEGAAAARQQQLMRHAFPYPPAVGQLPGQAAEKRPGNSTSQRRPRTR